jgi:hypothetical protein
MSALLDETRRTFGAAPRKVGSWDKVTPPGWMKADDPLQRFYGRFEDLLANGDVIWGHVVQANALLFRPGPEAAPAHVLYGVSVENEDPREVPPERLRAAAGVAYALKGRKLADPALARVAAALEAETERHPPLDLPDFVTRGHSMRMAVVMVHRVFLPSRHLASSFIPLLVSRSRDAATLLPCRYWAEDLARGWGGLGACEG